MKRLFTIALLVLSLECAGQKTNQWNSWTDKESLREILMKARDEGRTYFSAFKFYDYMEFDKMVDSRMCQDLGFPLMYAMDFYQVTGNYFPKRMTNPRKHNMVSLIQAAWKKNRAIPMMSWHLHNPYANYDEYKKVMGCRYRYSEKGYPEKHRYVVHEILTNAKVDTLGIEYMGDWFDAQVREVAELINTTMVGEKGEPIPFVFRLWHEQQDSWAWWQYAGSPEKSHVSIEDYKAFWRLTVELFRKYCPKAEILWCYGPDRYFGNEAGFMKSYPGDDVVDVIGYDDYNIGDLSKFHEDEYEMMEAALKRARIVSKAAEDHGKIAIVAETNCMKKEYRDSYFKYVQQILQDPEVKFSIFQLWSMSYDRESTYEFIRNKNIIFNK